MKKKILITGASKNLGNFLSLYFKEKKFDIIKISRKKKLDKSFYNCDLSNEKKTLNTLKKIKKRFKKLNFIIVCAGDSKKSYSGMEKYSDWKKSFDNNFFSFVNLLRAYLIVFKSQPVKIVVISSIVSKKITEAPVTYSVAKSSLNYYAKIYAKKLAEKKISLTIINPGNILMKNNNWAKKIKENKKIVFKYIKNNVPSKSFIDPVEIAECCEYIFSSRQNNLCGSEITIDGGESL